MNAAQKLRFEIADIERARHDELVRKIEADEVRALESKLEKLKTTEAAANDTPTDPTEALRAQLRATKCPREAGILAAKLNAIARL